MMKILKISIVLITCLLAGCAGMNSDFNCNKAAGDQCMSVTETNDMARQGQAGVSMAQNSGASDTGSIPSAHLMTYPLKPPMPGVPVRAGESVQRLWIAPWIDTAHTFHEPSVVYFVKTPSHWNTLSVQAVSREGQ